MHSYAYSVPDSEATFFYNLATSVSSERVYTAAAAKIIALGGEEIVDILLFLQQNMH